MGVEELRKQRLKTYELLPVLLRIPTMAELMELSHVYIRQNIKERYIIHCRIGNTIALTIEDFLFEMLGKGSYEPREAFLGTVNSYYEAHLANNPDLSKNVNRDNLERFLGLYADEYAKKCALSENQ